MEKTALQQLIVRIDWMIENSDPVHCAGLELAKSLAMSLLPAERDDAKAFFKAGQKYGQQLQIEARGGGKFLNKKHFDKYYETRYGGSFK